MRALDGLRQFFGDVLVIFFEGFGAGREALPFELDAGSFQDADGRVHHLGTDAVAGNQRDFMCHSLRRFADCRNSSRPDLRFAARLARLSLVSSSSFSSAMNSRTSLKSR